ncbi:hypothetical protein RUM44_011430 [Polyplax serrata]|uniref:Aquaporin n=1 Tax=Polyplax serrata TaxID=468196 RepID=A0ABR1AQ46_POLSC
MVTFGTSSMKFRSRAREFLAEFLGTFLLVFIGNNAVAQTILSDGAGGNSITIYFGYGFGLFLGVLLAGGVSGGHLNPAVSVAGAIMKKFKWQKVPYYMLAQYLGAFIAACGTYAVYADSFKAYHALHGINKTTASVFATFPKDDVSVFGSFLDQVLGSMILLLGIYAITDPFNKVSPQLVPIYVSLTLISIACSLGINQGFAVNPARDLAPRFFTFLTSWGSDVFSPSTYWYITLIGPHIGAVIGSAIYVFVIEKLRLVQDVSIKSGVANLDVGVTKNKFCKYLFLYAKVG